MVTGWGVMIPLGILSARFYKRYDPQWFLFHRWNNAIAYLLTIAGFIIAHFMVTTQYRAVGHATLGVIVTFFGLIQIIIAQDPCRPHKNADKTSGPKRRRWELQHWYIGRLTVIIAFITISLGMYQLNVNIGVYIAWAVWLALYVSFYIAQSAINRGKIISDPWNMTDQADVDEDKHK